jgi:hypothetical protein
LQVIKKLIFFINHEMVLKLYEIPSIYKLKKNMCNVHKNLSAS